MKGIEKAQMGMIAVLALMLVSIKRRLPAARKLSSGITTLTLAGIVLLVAVGSASADTNITGCNFNANVPGETYYYLEVDLTCGAGESGVIIGADNVVIDGQGHSITGAESATACQWVGQSTPQNGICGVINQGYDNVVIKDLEIENFCDGIGLAGTMMNKVENNTITGCNIHDNGNATAGATHGIHLAKVCYTNISKNEIHDNTAVLACGCAAGGNGIFLFGEPSNMEYAHHNTITCNNIHNNRNSGVFMKAAPSFNYIAYNHAHDNGQGGITLRCGMTNDNTVEYNNASYNKGTGLFIRGNRNTYSYNTVINNTNGSEYATGCGSGTPAYAVGKNGVGIRVALSVGTGNVLYNNTA